MGKRNKSGRRHKSGHSSHSKKSVKHRDSDSTDEDSSSSDTNQTESCGSSTSESGRDWKTSLSHQFSIDENISSHKPHGRKSDTNDIVHQTDKKKYKSSKSDYHSNERRDSSTYSLSRGKDIPVSPPHGRRSEPTKGSTYNKECKGNGRRLSISAVYQTNRSNTKRRNSNLWIPEDSEFLSYEKEFLRHNGDVEYIKIKEITHDLFQMSEEYSLAHCVAEDMNMGSGIAVPFRYTFKRVDQLLNQRPNPGGLAVLNVNNRFIYYLVTKRFSSGKPTYSLLFSSLKQLKQHVINDSVDKLAMPRIGCGLDRLQWENVKFMLEFVFRDVNVDIVVCNLEKMGNMPLQRHNNCKVVNETCPLEQLKLKTTIVYFCSEDDFVSEEMKNLDEKFHFLEDFSRCRKSTGDVIFFKTTQNILLCGCMIKKSSTDRIDFVALQKCVDAIQGVNKKAPFYCIAFQAITEDDDSIVTHKIINLVRNTMTNVTVHVCWVGDLKKALNEKTYASPWSAAKNRRSNPENSQFGASPKTNKRKCDLSEEEVSPTKPKKRVSRWSETNHVDTVTDEEEIFGKVVKKRILSYKDATL